MAYAGAMLNVLCAEAPTMTSGLWTLESLLAFLTLTAMETVLGIDNLVFIAIVAGKLPPGQRDRARQVGLMLAVFVRVGLLLGISWLASLTTPLFAVGGLEISGKSLIMLGGGLFLVFKATKEIHAKVEGVHESHDGGGAGAASFGAVLGQILVIDAIFSIDSVVTAVGMAQQVPVMVAAVVASVCIMLVFSKAVTEFVNRHPTIKVLALSFLILIGVVLMADGLGQHVNKGYIYFAMAFSLVVDLLQMRMGSKARRREHAERAGG